MKYNVLGNTGLKVSEVGFGASPLGDVFKQTDPAEGERAVHLAIDLGINLFDTSPYYGKTLSEERLGKALEGRRDKVVLATKCGRYDAAFFDFSADRITRSVDESLARLRTDYIDIFQAHDIEFTNIDQIINETIPAMRRLQEQGKVRFVGVTGLPLKAMRRVAEAVPVDTFLSYCRYNLLIDDMDTLLTPFAQQHGIGLINASPLHMGVLTERGAPSWHPAPAEVVEAGRKVVELCKAADVAIGDIGLQYCLAHPYAASTLVGMSNTEHVSRNAAAAEQSPDPVLLKQIEAAVAPVKNIIWPSGLSENQDYA